MKGEKIRLAVYKVVCLAVKNHGHGFAAQIQMMQDLQYFEHLSEPMADILNILENEFDHTQLADDILRWVFPSAPDAKWIERRAGKSPKKHSTPRIRRDPEPTPAF
jgi:condensin complex subunit 1